MQTIRFDMARTHDGQTLSLIGKMANRHGLIAGATGTGKTVTLRRMAEGFSQQGIPVLLIDVKGDLSGLALAGEKSGKIAERMDLMGLDDAYLQAAKVRFWDVFAEKGIPLRVTLADMGPLLLARLLKLNDTQEGILNIVFRVVQEEKLPLVDLQDLRTLLQWLADHAAHYRLRYGNISSASIGAIQRQILRLENEGATLLFGQPEIQFHDLLQQQDGQGVINILQAERLMQAPHLFSAVLLWLLTAVYQSLPETGDMDKPRFVLFFDEAHLLFDHAPPALVDKAEQVVRLIRSKGVGVYFCTQNPLDLPDAILGQLGNRIQHALRAFTAKDQRAIRAVAENFRINEKLDVANVIGALSVGEALVSFLDEKGAPVPVERALIYPPSSRLSLLSQEGLQAAITQDFFYLRYRDRQNHTSAAEVLSRTPPIFASTAAENEEEATEPGVIDGVLTGIFGQRKKSNAGAGYNLGNQLSRSITRNIVNRIGRAVSRAITDTIMRRK